MRTLWTLVGMGMLVLGASPLVWAQGAGPVTVTACLPCHGGGAAGPPAAPTFPKLDGQHAAYLEKQLREYKSGKRKTDVMAPADRGPEETADSRHGGPFRQPGARARRGGESTIGCSGKVLYEEGNRASGVPGCIGCHLPNGAGYQRYPRLAGQLQAYTVQQLVDFKSGTRSNDRARVMRLVAGRLTDEEIRAVAEYLAGLK